MDPSITRSLLVWLALNVILSGLGGVIFKLQGPISPVHDFYWWDVKPVESGISGALEGIWLRWDAVHYLQIVQKGYNTNQVSAFFPLYPLIGKAASWLLGGDDLGGLLLTSRLAFLFALIVLYKMTANRFGDEIATSTILFISIYPMGVYWFAPYPLGLALFLTLFCLQCAMNKRWLAAAIVGLAAGLTHGTTFPLAFGLLTIWFMQVRQDRKAWWLLPAVGCPSLGTLSFFAWRSRLGFPSMTEVLFQNWGREIRPPWLFSEEIERFVSLFLDRPDGWINLALFLFGVGMLVVCIRRLEPSLWVYQLGMILFLCSTTNYTNPFGSYGRYIMMAFPTFMALSLIVRKKWVRLTALGVGFFCMLLLAGIYFEWGWLA